MKFPPAPQLERWILEAPAVTVRHIITHYNQDAESCFSSASIPVSSPWGTLLLGAFCRRRLRAVAAVVLPAVQPFRFVQQDVFGDTIVHSRFIQSTDFSSSCCSF